jgi:RNA polymerase sigma-70 factor (ECF subfamily)
MAADRGSAGATGTAPPPGDRQLVAQTLAGDKEAFAVLHRRYYARVYRLALLRCGCPPDAEDIASETFVRAITHLPGYRFQGESLFPWLSRICVNLVADRGRRRAPAALVSLDAPTGEGLRALLDALPGDAPDPHALAERHEVQTLVRAAVANLPPDQMNAVVLRFVGDLPLKEIALALGKTEGAIKALLHRAMIGLRTALLQNSREAEVFGDLAARTRGAASASSAADQENTRQQHAGRPAFPTQVNHRGP